MESIDLPTENPLDGSLYVKSLFGAQSADTITVFTIFLRSNNKMRCLKDGG
jgi:hypothetical protein